MEDNFDLTLEKIVNLAKRRGFIFPGSEIYGGLSGTWDYGPLGVALKENIKASWRRKFATSRNDMYELDSSILMNPQTWVTSGHAEGFADPMVECEKCKKRFREDQIEGDVCPECGGKFGSVRQFNLMFETRVGALEDSSSKTYLRPETAQGIFLNFKNIIDTFHPKLPFGVAQIGKAFRNEITPRDFIFRSREFEQMEIEYFVKEEEWQKYFEYWKDEMMEWISSVGIDMGKIKEIEKEDLAHYSKRTVDIEFVYPFGQKELFGLAYRTNYDLSAHSDGSGQKLEYLFDDGSRITPHVIEPSFGLDRAILAVLVSAYREQDLGEEVRTYLKLPANIAPVNAAVFPLVRNKEDITDKARIVFGILKEKGFRVQYDDNGNIGKRYRRQDEIGTPFCITVDYDTLENNTVTVRDRDTQEQKRIPIDELTSFLADQNK
ncbi:MAG: glycine--tRNA ligase [Candidatus Pacebacteria bacterium]|jgi:glycyl-tRNA synthetase|nr:glycine--tRNA ligase [Candidatus Paceibacterota bacterium]